MLKICEKKLNEVNIDWVNKKSLCVVICSKGYPDNFEKSIEIDNLKNITLNNNDYLFHAGTEKKNGKIYAIGGRVLNFVSLSDEFSIAKNNINKKLNELNWTGGFYRKDIGHKVIE